MSESTRALCQIIEARPFLTLTDQELQILTYLVGQQLDKRIGGNPVSVALHGRLIDEVEHRRGSEPLARGNTATSDACTSTAFVMGWSAALRCNGLKGHGGVHHGKTPNGAGVTWP